MGIRDVAKAAGVSITTVSHVLNETPNTRTSESTRERVRDAASELGYSPNRLARGLRTRSSGMIGLLTEDIATTPHAGRIILGAQEEASSHNLTLAIINSHVDAGAAARRADARELIERHADGIIYATVFHREVSVPVELRAVPAVLIGAVDVQGLVPAVLPDEATGAANLTALLVAAGHRRIGFTNSSVDVPATRGRLIGHLRALAQAGIARDDSLIVSGLSEASGGYAATLELLSRRDRPTAVFCYNDRMAMGAYRAAAELGLHIPRDVSIVGFDDQAPIAESIHPSLTTVALPHYEMGAWAVATLTRLIQGSSDAWYLSTHPTLMQCPVVERHSVGPPQLVKSISNSATDLNL
ncbi:LacI family DNA-binding transcriptional regulator [Marisediminicola antarctica]|uniref:LacI family DNA-binding transcriptional regulator n=1 Tax=Marisediminicola antarctica TaxID=674079 RepID=UPI003005B1B8